ncbi:phosphatase PAP2 family protein, partial [Streptomyces sp. IBSBF 2806]|uniref:phosphatase PAP2 family protein n=1 Tax=Streptomyces sp. IBSBF 2806 TaxID=2903529 RepID=UPI002FDBEF37
RGQRLAVRGPGGGGAPHALANQSLHGALLRLGLSGPLEIGLFLSLGAAVAVIGVHRAVRYARDGQLLLAVALTGCAAIVVSPTTWQHQLLWVLPTIVGRVGRRASDRYVWPVAVILVTTLPATMMLPHMEVLHPLRDNAVLLLAIAAATVVPFLPRTSPHYRTPIPTECAEPVPARGKHVPLLPFLQRVLTRPNLLLELLLLRVTYAAYQQVRLAATGGTNSGGRARAEAHGRDVLGLERLLHIDIERTVNHWVVGVTWLRNFFDFYYGSLHFVVPLTVLGVLYWRRPVDYRWARSSLGFATLLALVGFWLYPLAPPRLMPNLGVIDTVHGVQDFSKPDYGTLTSLTNQYAAMPSLHFGWSLWCGLVVAIVARSRWTKSLGLLHPLFTVSAIVATGNHWVLDAAGGAAVVCAGFGLSYVLMGPRARSAAPTATRTTTTSPKTREKHPAPN